MSRYTHQYRYSVAVSHQHSPRFDIQRSHHLEGPTEFLSCPGIKCIASPSHHLIEPLGNLWTKLLYCYISGRGEHQHQQAAHQMLETELPPQKSKGHV